MKNVLYIARNSETGEYATGEHTTTKKFDEAEAVSYEVAMRYAIAGERRHLRYPTQYFGQWQLVRAEVGLTRAGKNEAVKIEDLDKTPRYLAATQYTKRHEMATKQFEARKANRKAELEAALRTTQQEV